MLMFPEDRAPPSQLAGNRMIFLNLQWRIFNGGHVRLPRFLRLLAQLQRCKLGLEPLDFLRQTGLKCPQPIVVV